MKPISHLIFLLVFVLNAPHSIAQNYDSENQIYGLNPILYNGKVYDYFLGPNVKGNQYFNNSDFLKGCITLREQKFEDVLLNYDILNQELILKYTDNQESQRLLIVSKAWLGEFSLGNEHFIVFTKPDGEKMIVQEINQGKIRLLRLWTKKLTADLSFGSESYVITKRNQKLYLTYNKVFAEYSKIKDLLVLLNMEKQKKVKNYLRQNKIKARTSDITELSGLFDYCNQINNY
jgi:hypothetical protein